MWQSLINFAFEKDEYMKIKGYILAALAAAAYGTNPLFAINLYQHGMNANSVLIFRYLLGLPLLAAMILLRGHSLALRAREIVPVAVLGVLMAFSSLTLFESYNYMNSGIASTLLFVYPVMVALLMTFFFHERFKTMTGVCLAVMAGGLMLLMRNESGVALSGFGILLVMVSSLTYAFYIVMVNVSATVKAIPTLKLLFYVLLFGSSVFFFMIPLDNPLILPGGWQDWFNLAALAVIPTLLSLTCTTVAIQYVGPTTTAIFGALEPVTAVVLSVVALGQTITAREITGALLIVAATTLVVIGDSIEPALLRVRKMFPAIRHKK